MTSSTEVASQPKVCCFIVPVGETHHAKLTMIKRNGLAQQENGKCEKKEKNQWPKINDKVKHRPGYGQSDHGYSTQTLSPLGCSMYLEDWI